MLAVLVPFRGAVAAAMLCPVGTSGSSSELHSHEGPADHEGMDHAMAHWHANSHEATHSGGHDHSAHDKCTLCAAYCSLTPMVSAVWSLPQPLDLPAIKFPDFSSPAPSFLSGGQERPPRTI